jgi:hypothetical protein
MKMFAKAGLGVLALTALGVAGSTPADAQSFGFSFGTGPYGYYGGYYGRPYYGGSCYNRPYWARPNYCRPYWPAYRYSRPYYSYGYGYRPSYGGYYRY